MNKKQPDLASQSFAEQAQAFMEHAQGLGLDVVEVNNNYDQTDIMRKMAENNLKEPTVVII